MSLELAAGVVLGLVVLGATVLGVTVTAAIDSLRDRRTPPGKVRP